MKNYKFKINGNQYEVAVNDIQDNIASVEVNGVSYKVEIEGDKIEKIHETKPVARKASISSKPVSSSVSKKVVGSESVKKTEPTSQASSGGAHPIKSPLPGVILKVLVNEGDKISKGDVVLVMEAMKMENNISSDKDGVVSAIKVSNGQSILQNEILIEIQ